MNSESQKDLSSEVLEKIKSGQVKMRPKSYYFLKAAILVVAAGLAFFIVIFLISFTLFVLQGNGSFFLAEFGWPGIKILALSFPWALAGVTVLFILLLEFMIKRFSFAYRRPLVYSFVAVVALLTLLGISLTKTPLHFFILKAAIKNRLPFANDLYRGYAASPLPHIFHGVISGNAEMQSFQIEFFDGEKMKVEVSTSSQCFKINPGELRANQRVMIMGEKEGLGIKACGLKRFEKDDQPFFVRPEIRKPQK